MVLDETVFFSAKAFLLPSAVIPHSFKVLPWLIQYLPGFLCCNPAFGYDLLL